MRWVAPETGSPFGPQGPFSGGIPRVSSGDHEGHLSLCGLLWFGMIGFDWVGNKVLVGVVGDFI